MYARRVNAWGKHLDFIILDAVMLELALFVSYGVRNDWVFLLFTRNYKMLALFLAMLSVFVGVLSGKYHGILRRGAFRELGMAFFHASAVEMLTIVVAYFIKEFTYSRGVFLILWVFATLFCWAERCLWRTVLKAIGIRKSKRRQVLLVTTPDSMENEIKKWNDREIIDCEICGICLVGGQANDAGPEERTFEGIPVVSGFSEFKSYLLNHVTDEVLIRPGGILGRKQMDEILQTGLTVHIGLEDRISPSVPTYVENFAGADVLTSAMRLVRPWEMWVKRLMDIAGGLVGLAVTGIACIFVIPAIKLSDPGPAFFSQIRVGRNGRRFKIYKFRSMYKDAEERKKELMSQNEMEGAMFKMKDDPRIIKGVGQFIRRTSIDELPQFWNVLKGDMSLVGTRPPTEEEYNTYEMRYLRRLSIRPGITGIWQTSGRNEITDFEDVVRMDTEYIVSWSLLLDIKLLLKTVKVVLTGEGSM